MRSIPQERKKMNKFKVGDKVKWNDGHYHHNDKRIDVITAIKKDYFNDVRYCTKEVNNEPGTTPKIGLAFESYLVLA